MVAEQALPLLPGCRQGVSEILEQQAERWVNTQHLRILVPKDFYNGRTA